MPTNVTVAAVTAQAVIYLQDGTTMIVEPGGEQFVQLVEAGFCTISEVPADVDEPDPIRIGDIWRKVWDIIRQEIQEGATDPQPTPHA